MEKNNSVLEYIENSLKFGIKLGLGRIQALLSILGNPQRDLKFVHVAGTNGKGSTSQFISSILIESGYRVGLFTSPFLEVFNERIKIDGENISDEDLKIYIGEVKEAVDKLREMWEKNHISLNSEYNRAFEVEANYTGDIKKADNLDDLFDEPTEFEIVTAAAFLYFKAKKVDIVVLEVGLGGTYDSTNVIEDSELSVITRIGIDHTDVLGDDITEIADQKAGIIKEKGEVVSWPQTDEAMCVVRCRAKEKNAKLKSVDFSSINTIEVRTNYQKFSYEGETFEIRLNGYHQIKNAVLAIESARVLEKKYKNITDDNIKSGLKRAFWPGRIEVISKNPWIVLDGAHNLDGAKVLLEEITRMKSEFIEESGAHIKESPNKNVVSENFVSTLVIGMLKDKEYEEVSNLLKKEFSRVIITEPNSPRALRVDEFEKVIKKDYAGEIIKERDIEKVVEIIREDSDFTLICGSLYLIGEIRKIIKFF